MELFDRFIEFQCGSLLISSDDLDIEFKVENSNKDNAGQAEIVIYNLGDVSKSKIKKDETVQLKAGYRDDYGIIFYGKVDKVEEEWEGGDVKTIIYASDLTKQLYQAGYIVKVYPKGTPIAEIVKEMFQIAGIPIGRIEDPGVVLQESKTFKGSPKEIIEKCIALANGNIAKNWSGISIDAMLERLNQVGWTAYTEYGMGYFVRKDFKQPELEAIVLSSETGLMEVTKHEDKNSGTTYKIRCLLNWKIRTDTLIQLESIKTTGLFKVVEYCHICRGEDYYTECGVKAV